jgi:hypothetical protein
MKTRFRDHDRTAGVGSVKRPSPGFGAMGDTRRKRPFPSKDGQAAVFGIMSAIFSVALSNSQPNITMQPAYLKKGRARGGVP